MWAEAASALDPRLNDDNASLDNLSMSESIDGYAAAVASHMGLGLGAAHGGGHTAHAGGHAAYGAGAAAGNHAAALALGAVLQAATLPGSAAALAAAEARAAATGSAGAGAMSAGPGSTTGQDGYGVRGSALQPRGLEWVEQDGEMVLEVAPLPGRLVLFLSGAVDHALQPIGPAADAAVSVTAWYQ